MLRHSPVTLIAALAFVAWPLGPGPGEAGADEGDDTSAEWSATVEGQYRSFADREAESGIGGFFDRYEFTPNKNNSFPFEIGVTEGALDVFDADDEALFLSRLRSPSSNLGVSGSEIGEPFFNQHLDARGRLDGFDLDLRYWRIRTEKLRRFPDTASAGLLFDDRSDAHDRFFRDRTGFSAEARMHAHELFDRADGWLPWLSPTLALRGGFEGRQSLRQLRFQHDPSNDWLGLASPSDHDVSDVGTGLTLVPGGRLTVVFDYDYQRFDQIAPTLTEGDLGYPPPEALRAIRFAPSFDRSRGTVRIGSRLGERASAEAGFRIDHTKQIAAFTPAQTLAGLEDNALLHYSANAGFEWRPVRRMRLTAFVKYDQRDNEIDRTTPLYNPTDSTQVDPFLRQWRRTRTGAELGYRFRGMHRASLGFTYDDVERVLDFAEPGSLRILPENSHIAPRSRKIDVYGRGTLRPLRSLSLRGEIGYRAAPDTGYIVELDDYVYGRLHATWVVPSPRSVVVTAHVRGSSGRNRDFSMLDGLGPLPAGPVFDREFERWEVDWGLTLTASPWDDWTLFASFQRGRDQQDNGLDQSNLQRYLQDQIAIDFSRIGLSRYQNRRLALAVGGRVDLDTKSDAALRYGFTRAEGVYDVDDSIPDLARIAASSDIDSDTHHLDLEAGRWLREGLRVLLGYRYQHHADRASVPESIASAVTPRDRSTHQHMVRVGVTLTSDFFERED